MKISDYENYQEIKEHYSNDFSYNTYPCTIPLDFPSVPLHWHNEMEFIYIKKGTALITIDMNNYILDSNCIAIILPGHIHGIQQHSSNDLNICNTKLEYENIIFDLKMLYPKQGDIKTEQFFDYLINNGTDFPCIITPELPEYTVITDCLNEADNICNTFPDGYYLAIRSCLYKLFFSLNKIISLKRTSKKHDNLFYKSTNSEYLERIKTITKYIEHHYSEDISVQKMADICNISHSHFMKFFKTHMGTSFINYLNDYRLITASRLLTASDSSIIDIAAQCGFDNVSYFNRIFKKKYHMSPKQLRNSMSSPLNPHLHEHQP